MDEKDGEKQKVNEGGQKVCKSILFAAAVKTELSADMSWPAQVYCSE